jgi:hypothetical protein
LKEGEDKEQDVIRRKEDEYVQSVNEGGKKLTNTRALLLTVIDKM